MLRTYAALSPHRGHDAEPAAALHQGPAIAAAHAQLTAYISGLISSAALPSKAAVERLVEVTLTGIRRPESSRRR